MGLMKLFGKKKKKNDYTRIQSYLIDIELANGTKDQLMVRAFDIKEAKQLAWARLNSILGDKNIGIKIKKIQKINLSINKSNKHGYI